MAPKSHVRASAMLLLLTWEVRNNGVRVASKGIMFIPNFVKVGQVIP
jgi:hypothetical protein